MRGDYQAPRRSACRSSLDERRCGTYTFFELERSERPNGERSCRKDADRRSRAKGTQQRKYRVLENDTTCATSTGSGGDGGRSAFVGRVPELAELRTGLDAA